MRLTGLFLAATALAACKPTAPANDVAGNAVAPAAAPVYQGRP